MSKWRRNKERGFSLIEMVVAMAVLTIGILGVVPMLAFNIKANTWGKNYTIASYLAQQKLEQIRSWPLYEDFDANNPGITLNNTVLFGTETGLKIGEHYQSFNRTTEMVRNGYSSPGWNHDCDGILFATSSSSFHNVNEGLIIGGGSLNSGNVGERCGSTYRGEDFKMVRVTIAWDDYLFPPQEGMSSDRYHHEIVRHMYLAGF